MKPFMYSVLAAINFANASPPLFIDRGPRVTDLEQVVLSAGWFEITVTGIVLTAPTVLSSNITNANETHAKVSMWSPSSGPDTTISTVTVPIRLWSSTNSAAWPAALYDAFHILYVDELQPNVMTPANQAALNASELFRAVMGPVVMQQCDTNVVDRMLLAQQNTVDGPVIEAISQNNITTGVIEHVFQSSSKIVIANVSAASYWSNCIFFFRQK